MTHPPSDAVEDAASGAGETVRVIVVMGVAGAGKTTIGRALATALRCAFVDGDDFHDPANVERMRRGVPLTDAEREPWLAALRAQIGATIGRGERVVIACSALKHSYRLALVPAHSRDAVRFVYLDVDRERLQERLESRVGHFAGAALLESQLATLEEPRDALRVDGASTPESIVARIRSAYGL